MKTIPTLCASATVTGVSVVGCAIGTIDSPDEALHPPSHDARMTTFARRVQHNGNSSPAAFDSSPFSHSSARSHSAAPRQTSVERSHSKRLRRMTTGGSFSHQATDMTMQAVAEDAITEAQPPLRSRPSWLRRLSTMSLSAQSTASSTASRPVSAAMSFSAGSTNFSRAGSTVPIFGEPQQPLPRNKLIKRSSSLRGSIRASSQEGSSRFSRPMTSHDRIRTLRERPSSAMMEPLDWSDSELPGRGEQHHKPRWRHYFAVKAAATVSETPSSGSSRDGKPVRRLFPDEQTKPFLLMAESIITTEIEVDETLRMSHDAESLMFGSSRPMTPAGIDGDFVSPHSTTTATSKRGRPEPGVSTDEQPSRRSFSFSDLLSRGPSLDKPRNSFAFGDRFLRRRSMRVSSAPTTLTGTGQSRQSIELQHERERPAKRRESDAQSPHALQSSNSSISNDFHFSTASPLPSHRLPISSKNASPAFLKSESPTIPEENASSLVENSSTSAKNTSAMKGSQHRLRPSVTHSEHTSTLGGSDYDNGHISSGDDDDTDKTSDTVFDSIRTRATRSTSGVNARGARIETIFDESPPQKGTQIPQHQLGEQDGPNSLVKTLNVEAGPWPGLETVSTPTGDAASTQQRTGSPALPSTPPLMSRTHQGSPVSPQFHSSPPKMHHLSIQRLERQVQPDLSDVDMWDVNESTSDRQDDTSDGDEDGDVHDYERVATPVSFHRTNPMLVDTIGSSSTATTPVNLTVHHPVSNRDSVSRSSVFDWSEPPETSVGSNTPPRPKTVHGKKQSGKRGSRAGRRAPSGLHVRSQSVPVVPDIASTRKENLSAKFGTWNAGNGPTEEWDDDFDFGEPPPHLTSEELDEKRIDSGFGMHIPKSIRDQQGSMQQNRKLITDMYHYAGALRDLQRHAIRLEMIEGEHIELFKLVDAIIALADEESEELAPGNFSPPSSPGFDADAFEENPHGVKDRMKQKIGRSTSARYSETPMQTSGGSKLRRKSVLPPHDSLIFTPPGNHNHAIASEHGSSPSARLPETPKSSRPRKDSVARAKLVIEHFQGRNNVTPTNDEQADEAKDKMAFDTATLRNLVPFVKEVVDKAKAAIREYEALYSSPEGSPQAPAEPQFTDVFKEPPRDGSPSNRPRRFRASPPNDGVDNDLTQPLKLMTLV